MTEKEFLNSISNECVVVSIEKYENMVSSATTLTLVRQLIESDESTYGLSSETTKAVETLLGVVRSKK